MKKFPCSLQFIALAILPFLATSQTAIDNTIAFYHQSIGSQSGIYNGFQYYRYPGFINSGHPFYFADSLTKGSVYYDGVFYENVSLLYDEVTDELLTTDFRGDNLVQLVKLKVDSFTINDFLFIKIVVSQSLFPGYYRQLYSGETSALAKEVKTIAKTTNSDFEVRRTVESRLSYYVKFNEKYYGVSGAKQLLKLFGAKRRQVADHMKSKRINYRSNREDYIVEAVTFYDEQSL